MSKKYPRTYHLPWSLGKGADDKVIENVDFLLNTPLVITEKLDGGNCCMNRKDIFARTHANAPNHPSFNLGKALHASIKNELPKGLDFFGEYCYAKHSIEYSELPGYFLLFAIRDNYVHPTIGFWRSWSYVKDWAKRLNISTVPELEKIKVSSAKELQKEVDKHMEAPSIYGGEREGIVVRRVGHFSDIYFNKCIAKFVRKNHVQTDAIHWASQAVIPNKLKKV